ncbi:MAG: hypothetical protein UX81_C0015G0001 [Parcubacteria group bacterium GW2011_GWA2_47_12]|nr:MAG: hypothetical protein UX81_C0015G0001 [Parcubacteria group bacterium GW2011_GWA2_47_12]
MDLIPGTPEYKQMIKKKTWFAVSVLISCTIIDALMAVFIIWLRMPKIDNLTLLAVFILLCCSALALVAVLSLRTYPNNPAWPYVMYAQERCNSAR